MRKKLIAALVIVCILLAAAIGVLIFLEWGGNLAETEPSETSTAAPTAGTEASDVPVETTEETVGISLPTEGEEERTPEVTWVEEEQETVETMPSVDPDATFDPDENELPEVPVD